MDQAFIQPPRRLVVPIDNRHGKGDLSVLDFGDPARPPDLIFLHANGFNAWTYRSLLAPLGSALRILAPDLRGHGQSTLPTSTRGRFSWRDHRDDLIALLDAMPGPPVTLAGHSMGATSALLAAPKRPDRVARLLLLEPVIWSRTMTTVLGLPLLKRTAARSPIARGALRRRAVFDTREDALKSYRGRGAFKGWSDGMLNDYLAGGLIETADGFTLACTPVWEASNYSAQAHDPWCALGRVTAPVRILKGQERSTCAVDPRDARRYPNLNVETVPGGHLFPMTHAEIARDALFEAAI